MSKKDLINKIIELGLTEYESRGYLSLLKKYEFTATELSRVSNVPRTRVYEILQGLVQKGLCIEILGKIKKYKAVDPETALDKLLEYQRVNLQIKENIVKSLAPNLQKQYLNGSNNQDPLDYIELLRDPKEVARVVVNLVANAKKEVLAFIKPPFSNPKKNLEEQNVKTSQSVENSIVCKVLYEISPDAQERIWQFRQIDYAAQKGEQTRIIKHLPMKMVIVDESKVVFAMEDYYITKSRQTSLIIEHHALAKSLRILFYTLWDKGRDYHDLLKT